MSMDLDKLQAFLKKAEDYAGRDEALRTAFLDVGTAMADILEMLEKQGPDTARAIADALKGLKLTVENKAPVINNNIEVKPTPVEVKVAGPVINVPPPPAPVVQLVPSEKSSGWSFDFDTSQAGRLKGTAKRL